MITTTMSSKGQIVLPSSLRTAHDWQPGTEFQVESVPEGVLLRPVKPKAAFPTTTLDQVFGIAGYTGPAKSIDEMDAAVLAEARKQRPSRK